MADLEPESVHSPVVRAHISHAVIARYVADALGGVEGIAVPPPRRGVRVSTSDQSGGTVDLDVRVSLVAGAAAPGVCAAAATAVRAYLSSMVAVEVGRLLFVIDGDPADGAR